MSAITIEDVTEDEFWRDGYGTGHEHGAAGLPNMLDVRGRPMAEVIPLFGGDPVRTGRGRDTTPS